MNDGSVQLPAGASLVHAEALMAIRSLELRARAVVQGFWSGLHRSPYHGFSVEFTEYRQYTPGDDPRHLDWRVFARSDRHYIKKFEDETNLRCHLLLDRSRSMEYGSLNHNKARYAATLAATFAHFLHQQGDAIGLVTFDDQVRELLPARHRPGHLRHVYHAIEAPSPGRTTDLVAPLERTADLVRKRGLIILISDFLVDPTALVRPLTRLAAGGHELCAFQVLDPAELRFTFNDSSLFEDVESGQTLHIDPSVARDGYLKKFNQHQDALRALCNRLGIAWHPIATDQPPGNALRDFIQDRSRRGRRFQSAPSGGSRS